MLRQAANVETLIVVVLRHAEGGWLRGNRRLRRNCARPNCWPEMLGKRLPCLRRSAGAGLWTCVGEVGLAFLAHGFAVRAPPREEASKILTPDFCASSPRSHFFIRAQFLFASSFNSQCAWRLAQRRSCCSCGVCARAQPISSDIRRGKKLNVSPTHQPCRTKDESRQCFRPAQSVTLPARGCLESSSTSRSSLG